MKLAPTLIATRDQDSAVRNADLAGNARKPHFPTALGRRIQRYHFTAGHVRKQFAQGALVFRAIDRHDSVSTTCQIANQGRAKRSARTGYQGYESARHL